MKLCTCFVLAGIFALTNCISRIIREEGDKSFNRTLRTVLDQSNRASGETKKLDNVQSVTTTVTDGEENLQLVFRAPKVETLTDFIQKTVYILNTYEDTAFKDFFDILDTEIRNYHYRGCRFSELMQNHNTRSLIANALIAVRKNEVTNTKANINEIADMLRDEMYDENVKDLLEHINSLYRNAEREFHRVLNNIKLLTNTKFRDVHNDLVRVIRDGVQSILFNHYSKLETHTRRELKEKIEVFWEKYKKSSVSNSVVNKDPDIKSVNNNVQVFKTIENKGHELDSSNDPKTFIDQIMKTVSKETYIDQTQNKETYNYENSIESGTLPSDYTAEEFPSDKSIDTSNSIKQSQEQHKEYNKQRYMTLYTEEVIYKARTTKKTEIIPMSEKLTTGKPKVNRHHMITPRYRPKHVSSNRKKKIKKLRTNQDMDDANQDISSDSSHDTRSGLMTELKHEPMAREHSDEQRHGVATTAVLRSQYDAVIDVKLLNTELLKSLPMFPQDGMDMKEDTKDAIQSNPVPTEPRISVPIMRAQNEIQPKILKPKQMKRQSKHSKKKTPIHRELSSEARQSIEPHLTDKFKEFVKKKINTSEDEFTKLKQISNLIFGPTNNDTDEVGVRNGTDNKAIKDKDVRKEKHLEINVIDLLENYYKLLKEPKYTVKTESTTYTYRVSNPKIVKNDAENATDTVNEPTSQIIKNKVNTSEIDTRDVIREVISKNITATVNTVEATNVTKFESVVTTPTRIIAAISEPVNGYQIIHHKNPFDHVNLMLQARTKVF